MADNQATQVGEALTKLDVADLVSAYSGLLCLSESTEDRNNIMEEFEKTCPGPLQFVYSVDKKERSDIEVRGGEVQSEEEFMPQAYGILMCFLTLQNMGRLESLIASMKDPFS